MGEFDIKWHLNPDVNVLAGVNGSGKSTILDTIFMFLSSRGKLSNIDNDDIENMVITFNNKVFSRISRLPKSEPMKSVELVSEPKMAISQFIAFTSLDGVLRINFIKTIETSFSKEKLAKIERNSVSSELDFQLYDLQIDYLDYQLNLSRKKDLIVENNINIKEDMANLMKLQNRFLEMLDSLFRDTGKKLTVVRIKSLFY